MSAIKVLVTGANGQLGHQFRDLASQYPSIELLFTERDVLPIDDGDAVNAFFSTHQFTHCINCAAYTAVDNAEEEAELAFLINANAVRNLAMACNTHKVLLLHFSTDYVFDGKADTPYKETDKTSPVNLYGASKLEGEILALQHNENTIVIRTSWVYSSFGKNFVKSMLRLMQEKESIEIVADQAGSPTYAGDLATAVFQIIMKHSKPTPGIYHYSNQGIISWFQFATAIKEIIQSPCIVNPIRTDEFPTQAKRPAYSALNSSKIRSAFGIEIPQWRESLRRCLRLKE